MLHKVRTVDRLPEDAVENQIEEQERENNKRKQLVEKKILLKQAEKAGLEDDPDVEVLRTSVEDLGEEIEDEALKQDEAAAALEEFKDRKATMTADEDLPEEAKSRFNDFKMIRERASIPAIRQLYQEKID